MIFKTKIISKYDIVEATVSVMHVEAMVKRLLDKFFKEENLPMPRIKVVSNIGSRWVGRCTYRTSDSTNTTIEIQKRITGDEDTLERVVAHELIHHCEYMKQPPTQTQLHFKWMQKPHGKFFQDWAAKINAVMGKDFVTVISDTSFIETDREYFLLVAPIKSKAGTLGWAWAARPSTKQKEIVERRKAEQEARLFKSKDTRFVNGMKIAPYGLSYSNDKETQDILKEMYEHGKQVNV